MKVYIVNRDYYDFDSHSIKIGGIQTYITDLSQICKELFDEVTIFVKDEDERTASINGCNLIGYNIEEGKGWTSRLAKYVKKNTTSDDLIIYYTDTALPNTYIGINSIVIQHGICWDIPRESSHSLLRMVMAKGVEAYRLLKRIQAVKTIVCVDYNFPNWYRTQIDRPHEHMYVIPNYTRIPQVVEKPQNVINIIFARRLCWYRGTKLFVSAIKPILSEFNNITVTIAGEGPDEQWMKDELSVYSNVCFTKFKTGDSQIMHADKHIAIIPTVGSEGTSLSLLEAMSSKCAVVCSDVGGMTNIVLNGFNGLIVPAGSSEALTHAIKKLIIDHTLREDLAQNGYETVWKSFSYERWKGEWIDVLNSVLRR